MANKTGFVSARFFHVILVVFSALRLDGVESNANGAPPSHGTSGWWDGGISRLVVAGSFNMDHL